MYRVLLFALTTAFFLSPIQAKADCTPQAPCSSPITLIGSPAPGYYDTFITGLSADASTVTGYANSSTNSIPYIWSNGTFSPLPTYGPDLLAEANAISHDGSIIVGSAAIDSSTTHAVRWQNGTILDLGTLSDPTQNSIAWATTPDAKIIVGESDTGNGYNHAFRWEGDASGGTMIDLGALGGDQAYSTAWAINQDGTIIAGLSETPDHFYHAYRWQHDSSGGSMTDLGTLIGPAGYSVIYSMNEDGTVLVGQSDSSSGYLRPIRWVDNSSGGTMTDLGVPAGGTSGYAADTDSTGNVVVGTFEKNGEDHAFRWTEQTGPRELSQLLNDAGVATTGFTLNQAVQVSPDGQFIAGNATLNQNFTGFLVRYYDGTPAPIAGITTPQAIQTSANNLSRTRFQTLSHHHAFAAPLLGTGQRLENSNQLSVFGSAGSLSAGGSARYATSSGFALLAGVAYAQEDYPAARLDSSITGALAVRWMLPDTSFIRPFAEAGGWAAPNSSLSLTRTYQNGAGTAAGTGSTNADLAYTYARAGIAASPLPQTQITAYVEIGREWLRTDAYSEPLSPVNPFEAHYAAGTDQADIAKFGASASAQLSTRVDATLWMSAAQTLASKSSIQANVAGIGLITPNALSEPFWIEYGARVGYRIADAVTVDAFINATSGNADLETIAHVGAALRTSF